MSLKHTPQRFAEQGQLLELQPKENCVTSLFSLLSTAHHLTELQIRLGHCLVVVLLSQLCHLTLPRGDSTPEPPSQNGCKEHRMWPRGLRKGSHRMAPSRPCRSSRHAVHPHTEHKFNSTHSPVKYNTHTSNESYSCCGNHNFKISDSSTLKKTNKKIVRQQVTFSHNFVFFKPRSVLFCCFIQEGKQKKEWTCQSAFLCCSDMRCDVPVNVYLKGLPGTGCVQAPKHTTLNHSQHACVSRTAHLARITIQNDS